MERPTWRPDLRAAVISKARVDMHRKPPKPDRRDGTKVTHFQGGGARALGLSGVVLNDIDLDY
ncbi:hypothetical protein [Streptomyces tibetensis]|uniref:hypothetical protein n=1 Tax=Streptomyces tibetensis TaxID=2382123 RepID=UPI0034050599